MLHEKDNQTISDISTVFTHLTDMVIGLTPEGEIIEFNPAAELYYQWEKSEIHGKNYIELCNKNDFSFPPLLVQSQSTLHQNNTQEFISTIVIKNQKRSASWKVIPFFDAKERVTLIFLIGKDITREKNTETGIKNTEKRLESVIESIAGNHWWKDINGRYLGCNDTVAKFLGLNSSAEIVGKTDYDLPWADTADELIKNDREVIESGFPQTREEKATSKDGRTLTFLVTKVPLKDEDGNIIGTIGTSTDITDRKLAEDREKQALTQAAEARVKAQAEAELRQAVMILSGSIAHDLRTPIAIIHMRGNTLKKYLPTMVDAYHHSKTAKLSIKDELPSLKQPRKSILESFETMGDGILRETRRMHNFIDITLKTLSQVLRGELTQNNLVQCSMWSCIDEVLISYPFIEKENELIRLQDWEERHHFDFMGNEILIFRILSNLLKNSLDQIRKNNRGEIFITTKESNDVNILQFKDTAGGAPPETIARMFDGYCTTKEEGTGVGLAFCKLTMKNFGGDIICNSVYGDYIEFVMTFPKLPITQNKS